jgi:hypothetical protein
LPVLLVVSISTTGCGGDGSDFRDGVPSKNAVSIGMPGASVDALTSNMPVYYAATYQVTTHVNGAVLAIVGGIEWLAAISPSYVDSGKAVFGPSHDNPLEPNEYRLTVLKQKKGNGYVFAYEGKPKGADDSKYVVIAWGTHVPNQVLGFNDVEHGRGSFVIDFDARNTLPQPDAPVTGILAVGYDHRTDDVKVDVNFDKITFNDDPSNPNKAVTATYHFTQLAKSTGTFQFTVSEVDGVPASSAPQLFGIESRWKQDGSGRADVQVSNGYGGAVSGSGSQCWDANYQETFFQDPLGTTTSRGEASACTFQDAQFFIQ